MGVSAGLQIYPKKIFRHTNKACKTLEKKACKARRLDT